MASAGTKISFTCPNCAKVLRAATRPPAGKKVKCPACGEAFLPELDEEEEATAIQSTSTKVKSKAPPRDNEDGDEAKPRSKKKRADDEDNEDVAPPRRKNRDEDDDDDRSIKKKGKQKSGGKGLLIVLGLFLLGGVGVLSCGLCGIGAFVWPGFLANKKSNLEPFVPPDANLVMGGNPKLLKTKSAELQKILRMQGVQGNNANREDIEFNSENLLVFGNTRGNSRDFTAVFVSTATDIENLKRNPALGAAQNVGGHTIHKITDDGKRNGISYDYIAFQPNNIVVAANGDQQAFLATLDRGKKAAQTNAALELSRSVNSSPFWLAMTLDNQMRDDLRRGMGQQKGLFPLPASVAAAVPAVDGIRGVTMTFDVAANQDVNIAANVPCKNAEDATKIKAAVEDSWNQLKALLQVGLMFQQPGQKKIPQAFVNDLTSIQFAAEGSSATAKLKLTSQAIQELAELANQQKFAQGPFPNPGPGPNPNPFPGPGPNPQPPGPNPQPPINNGPDVTPPPGAKLVNTFDHANLNNQEKRITTLLMKKGKTTTITMVSTTPNNQFADVDLYVLRGAAGEQVMVSDISIGPNGRVSFVAPATTTYRIRVYNRGPSIATSCVIRVFEQ
jgi:hypothetical protein